MSNRLPKNRLIMFGLFSKNSKSSDTKKLWFTTDIHCHVLPGIDDGSPDVATSVELIQGLGNLGIERIIASPHVAAVEFPNTPDTLSDAYANLVPALEQADIEIPVSYSAEYRIDENLTDIIAENRLIPYPGNYVLIENMWIQEPWNLDETIFNLQLKGYSPIFAHPERFEYYRSNPARLDELHSKIPFQINILSLAGYYGKQIKALAESLLKKGYCDFLGTDLHAQRHLECIQNYLGTKDAERHSKLSLPTLKNDKIFGLHKTK